MQTAGYPPTASGTAIGARATSADVARGSRVGIELFHAAARAAGIGGPINRPAAGAVDQSPQGPTLFRAEPDHAVTVASLGFIMGSPASLSVDRIKAGSNAENLPCTLGRGAIAGGRARRSARLQLRLLPADKEQTWAEERDLLEERALPGAR